MIEPCPMPGCDGECRVCFSEDGYVYVHCDLCGYGSSAIHVPDGCGASQTKWVTDSHNRLSRIVRAAEELAKALKDERDNEYRDEYTDVVNKAEDALEEAVEGGEGE